jgi:hypothetical protein
LFVIRSRARACRIGYKRIVFGFDAREAAGHASTAACHAEGTVATGIEDHEFESARTIQLCEHGVESDCLEVRIGGALERSIDWYKVILAPDLHSVACEKDDGDFCAYRIARNLLQRGFHPIGPEILLEDNFIEAEAAERPGDRFGIVFGIRQRANPVVAVPDYESNPGGRASQSRQNKLRDCKQGREHKSPTPKKSII